MIGPGSAVKCVRVKNHSEMLGKVFFVREVKPTHPTIKCEACGKHCDGLLFFDQADPPPIFKIGNEAFQSYGWASCCFVPWQGPEQAVIEKKEAIDA